MDREVLDRFYVRIKTPVIPNHEEDAKEVQRSYAEPHRFDWKKVFPESEFEFTRWGKEDVVGFLLGILGVILIIALTLFVAGIGG